MFITDMYIRANSRKLCYLTPARGNLMSSNINNGTFESIKVRTTYVIVIITEDGLIHFLFENINLSTCIPTKDVGVTQ